MDGLRWILLILGLLLVAGIYFADRYKRRAAQKGVGRSFNADDAGDLNINPKARDDGDEYQDALAGLNKMMHEGRESSVTGPDDDAGDDTIVEDYGDTTVADKDADEAAANPERLIIFYLKAPEGHAFAGPGLFEALKAAGLSLGSMGIFHDSDSHGQIIFSVANIFEPGTLDIDDVENFSTRGLALFMQLPLANGNEYTDETDAFERMLGKSEILAERLGGELQDENHQPLDNEGVARARSKLITA